jgi:hypothetical protein
MRWGNTNTVVLAEACDLSTIENAKTNRYKRGNMI